MLKRLLFIFFSGLITTQLGAVEGAAYLLNPEGVRSSALGGAYGAVPGSAESQWYNPAGLSGLDGAELSLTHQSLDDGLESDHIVLGTFLGWRHSLGLMYSSQGAQDSYRDNFGNIGGNFEDSDSVIGLGYAYDLGWISLGLEAKYLSESIEKLSGSSLAADVGVQGKVDRDQVLYGLSLQNLGSAPNLGGPEVSLPSSLRASLGWHLGDAAQALLLLGDYRYFTSTGTGALALGAEYSEVYDENSLALRAGWDFSQSDLGGLSGLNLGAGFRYKFFGLDYTWSPMDVLGNSQRIALTLTYDQKATEQEKSVADYLQINPNAAVLATPTPVPLPTPKPIREARVGTELEALMAASPTPTLSPTPEVQSVPTEQPKGIIGAIFSIFSSSKNNQNSQSDQSKNSGGILKAFFHILGFNTDQDQSQTLSDHPGQPTPTSDDDRFVNPNATPQAGTPGTASPQSTPTPQTTPMMQKIKGWFGL